MTTRPLEMAACISVTQGSRMRCRHILHADDDLPSFKTDRIDNGKRIGTVIVEILKVCPSGTCAFVLREDDDMVGHFPIDKLQPLED